MSMSTARFETTETTTVPDDFLSGVFGYPCRFLAHPFDWNVLSAELSAMSAGPAFVWTKVTGRDDPSFAPLIDLGFTIATEEITYERPAASKMHEPLIPAPPPEDFTVRKIMQAEAAGEAAIAEQVGALAARNLTTSRFHQDPEIPDNIAAEIKKRWAVNFFKGLRGQEMIVAMTPGGRIVGFNQLLSGPDGKVIDLICTAGDYRRHGVARALVEAMIEPGKQIRVGSQANNDAANKFYISMGFQPVRSSICLHWHAGNRSRA
ncbi:GNAT family N-acetyltransferase [Thalassospiraceae bacterium LMO-JJ14]|nr:GNAT family N-acetyltransferase [Thalassospiraceae bacterium LMO-JJ14]